MNVNIKSLFIILILSTYFSFSINSTEIIITIPDQYNTDEMPLPPFPEEVLTELETSSFDSQLEEKLNVRWIKQSSITYNYYTDFLNLKPTTRGYLSNWFIVESDFNNAILSCKPEYKSNNYEISGLVEYDINNELIDYNLEYKEYRAPLDFKTSGYYRDKSFSVQIGNRDYYNNWYINPIISNSNTNYNAGFSDKRFIRPHLQISYFNETKHYGAGALGFNFNSGNMRGGVSLVDRTLLPYAELYLQTGSFLTNLSTNVEEDHVDYLFEGGYKNSYYVKAGVGTDVYTDYDYVPYISFKENLFFGQREYKMYHDKFLFDFTIYKDSFLSIITFGYDRSNQIFLSLEGGIYNRFNLKTSLEYFGDNNEYLIELKFEYKVGKI